MPFWSVSRSQKTCIEIILDLASESYGDEKTLLKWDEETVVDEVGMIKIPDNRIEACFTKQF